MSPSNSKLTLGWGMATRAPGQPTRALRHLQLHAFREAWPLQN
jgi:hypothetical protein